MELEVDVELAEDSAAGLDISSPTSSPQAKRRRHNGSGDDADDASGSQPDVGMWDGQQAPEESPVGIDQVLAWPEYIRRCIEKKNGMAALRNMMKVGVHINTDFSGMGCPELAVKAMSKPFRDVSMDDEHILLWRASDCNARCRKILCAGNDGPQHVFGDLMGRLSVRRQAKLKSAHRAAEKKYRTLTSDGVPLARAATIVGEKLRRTVAKVLQGQGFGGMLWCYKHEKMCPACGPPADHPQHRAGYFRIAVAGTTCITWSSMGTKKGWAGWPTIPFMVWAAEVNAWNPHAIIHECVPLFDVEFLAEVFPNYVASSIVFSPQLLGIPSMRMRRWTLLTRKDVQTKLPFANSEFAQFCLRPCSENGHCYLLSEDSEQQERIKLMASKRYLPEHQQDGTSWSMRQVLPEGLHQKLVMYERHVWKRDKECKYIINLRQTPMYFKSLTEMMPALMTNSMLWDMTQGRLFTARELLHAHGIGSAHHDGHDSDGNDVEASGVELLLDKEFPFGQFVAIVGNSMHLVSFASVFAYLLCFHTAPSEH